MDTGPPDVATRETVRAKHSASAVADVTTVDNSSPAPASRAQRHSSSGASSLSPLDALVADERARTRLVVLVMYGLLATTLVALPLLGGHSTVKTVTYVLLAASALAAGALDVMNRRPQYHTARRAAAVWLVLVIAVCSACLYFGTSSPAPMVLVLGIYFVALGQSRWLAWTVYGICASFYGVTSVLIAHDVVADPGLGGALWENYQTKVIVIVMVEVILLATVLLGRWSRQATLFAVSQLERAVRTAAQRAALLQEAQQALDEALRPGGEGLLSGQVLGSYRLGSLLGRGGMGEIYEATHVETDAAAAVKLLRAEGMRDAGSLARFLRELEITKSLSSPHIVRVLEYGDLDADLPYLAMERLHGEDLSKYLRTARLLPLREVVELVRQVARGVDTAAAAGVVHRDLKPQNLFRASTGTTHTWKILDFGVSKLAENTGTLTQGRVVGTPNYMSPEQATGATVDHRADIYSLGVIAYRALTGHPPFRGKDLPAILMAVVYTMPARPSSLTRLPPGVDDVLAVAMAKRPEQRFDTATELARALAAASKGKVDAELRARAHAAQSECAWGATRGEPAPSS